MSEPTDTDRRVVEAYISAWFVNAPKTRQELLRLFDEAVANAREEGRQEMMRYVNNFCARSPLCSQSFEPFVSEV